MRWVRLGMEFNGRLCGRFVLDLMAGDYGGVENEGLLTWLATSHLTWMALVSPRFSHLEFLLSAYTSSFSSHVRIRVISTPHVYSWATKNIMEWLDGFITK